MNPGRRRPVRRSYCESRPATIDSVNIGGSGSVPLPSRLSRKTAPVCWFLRTPSMPKGGPAWHLHIDQDEWFYAVEGEFLIEVGQERFRLKPGDSLLAPRRVPHVWAYVGDVCGRTLITFMPAGKMEAFFPCGDEGQRDAGAGPGAVAGARHGAGGTALAGGTVASESRFAGRGLPGSTFLEAPMSKWTSGGSRHPRNPLQLPVGRLRVLVAAISNRPTVWRNSYPGRNSANTWFPNSRPPGVSRTRRAGVPAGRGPPAPRSRPRTPHPAPRRTAPGSGRRPRPPDQPQPQHHRLAHRHPPVEVSPSASAGRPCVIGGYTPAPA